MRKGLVVGLLAVVAMITSIAAAQEEDFTDPEYLKQFVGIYETEFGAQGEVVMSEDNVLLGISPEGDVITLSPTERDVFVAVENEMVELKFARDEEGNVISVDVVMPDGFMTLTKVVAEEEEAK